MTLVESYLASDGTIADLTLRDTKLSREVSDSVIGVPSLDLTASEVSQLTLSVLDPGFVLYKTGLFAVKTAMSFGAHKLEIAASGVTGDLIPVIEITARSAGIQALRRQTGAKIVRNISPTDYVTREARAVGLKVVAQPSAVQAQIVRGGDASAAASEIDNDETTWDVIQRIAGEIGFLAFEARNTVYFGKPSWLVKRSGHTHTVTYPVGVAGAFTPLTVPTCRRSVDAAKDAVTVEVELAIGDAAKVAPGDTIRLRGVPSFEANYMVTSLTFDIDGVSPVSVSATTPIDPEPQPPQSASGYFDGTGKSLADLLAGVDTGPVPAYTDSGIGLTSPTSAGGKLHTWPVIGSVGSGFGPRKRPGGFGSSVHKGIDIRAVRGVPIKASKGGTVTLAGWSGGYGKAVYIDHGGGVETRYAHMLTYLASVGQKVAQGQIIGLVDSTGQSTGDHLHFEIRINGVPVDPLPILQTKPGVLPGSRNVPI